MDSAHVAFYHAFRHSRAVIVSLLAFASVSSASDAAVHEPDAPTASVEDAVQAILETHEWSVAKRPHWAFNKNPPVIDEATDSPSGGGALKFTYPAGSYQASITGGRAGYENVNHREIYVGHWMKWSPNFTWNAIATKIIYLRTRLKSINTGGLAGLTVRAQSGGVGLALDVTIQGHKSLAKLPRAVYDNVAKTTFQRGQWYWLEVRAKLNTVGSNDGIVEVWVDDVQQMRYEDLILIDREDTWAYVQHSPEWGGSGGVIPETQFFWIDHTVISTEKIGRPEIPSLQPQEEPGKELSR